MAEDPKRQKSGGIFLIVGMTTGIFLAVVCLIVGFIDLSIGNQALSNKDSAQLVKLASFGSYLQGTTAAFWALAGVFLIFVAFLAQMMQLRLQRQDLEDQQERLENQEKITSRQNFETSFFQLLNLQNQIASNMRQAKSRYEHNAGGGHTVIDWVVGRSCFAFWYENLKDTHKEFQMNLNFKKWTGTTEFERVRECYEAFYTEKGHQEDLAHYFRTLYHLIKFVKISDVVVEYKDKRRYTSLVRAQLSAYELALLFYNGLSPYGEGFKPWIEEFGLLEHLDTKHLLLDPSHVGLYDKNAFK
ncbi:MAG TPA: putative phage abortive infection protein [Verrucomicrobiae bacterium]|nr:putative phage abortive infection protein [Verrucomicrobiae bacterium]